MCTQDQVSLYIQLVFIRFPIWKKDINILIISVLERWYDEGFYSLKYAENVDLKDIEKHRVQMEWEDFKHLE